MPFLFIKTVKPGVGVVASLCFLGFVAGFFYGVLSFGFIIPMLVQSAALGVLIVFIYSIIELILLKEDRMPDSLRQKYFIRILVYTVLVLFSLTGLSILHGSYSAFLSGEYWQYIIMDEYLPSWPLYIFYAFAAAGFLQSLWLLNKIRSGKN